MERWRAISYSRCQAASSRSVACEVTGGKLERAMRCREITAPIGLGYVVFSICSVGQAQWGGLDLMREKGRPDFDAREVTLLHRIIPHLSSGLKAAVLCKQASAKPEEKAPLEYWSSTTGDKSCNTPSPPNDGCGISVTSETVGWRARDSRLRCGWSSAPCARRSSPRRTQTQTVCPPSGSRHVRGASLPFTARGPRHVPAAGTRR